MTPATPPAALAAASLFVLGSAAALLGRPVGAAEVTPVLVAIAFLCAAGVARRRVPSAGWLASVAATGVAATLWFERVRPLSGNVTGDAPWVVVAAVASIWAIGTAAMAAGYATRPGQRLDRIAVPAAVVLVGWLAIGCATTVGLVLAGQREPDPAFTWVDVATVPVQVYVLVVLALVALGVIADVRAAAIRADERLTAAVDPGSRQQRLWALAVATARELVPGQATADAAIHDAERTRLAGDLHAVVLPSLRRAIAAAEADGDPETVASHLRTVDLELERLMADRWPVVLEALGLVRALEDLAERLEADGAPAIQIEVVGPGGRPPVAVERAAWRCGQVALDNAIRHGRPTAISVSVATAPSALQLTVADDGRGYVETTGGSVPRGRGIADARQRAADVGATVEVGPGTDGGTVVTFDWSTPTGH